jgi:phosphodiesterase/alkaline phosphatase D-like protein
MSTFKFTLVVALCLLFLHVATLPAADIYLGSGVKAGEVTHDSAIVLVRLTATAGQDAEGLIPGREGEARLKHSTSERLSDAKTTDWQAAKPDADWAIHFKLAGLKPASRHYYRVEYRTAASAASETSEMFSFLTAPPPADRAPVTFHLTTCQDLQGFGTYVPMAAQKPDFCVSAGDTVYYDGQCLARNVPEAWQAYQKMFGLPAMKDYYKHVGGYYMKDDHDYRFNDSDPHMKGRWVNMRQNDPKAKYTETKGNLKLDVNWLTHEEGARVFRQVFPMSEKPYRTFRWGRGLQVWLLENREFRSPNDLPDGPEKSIWGKEQKAWLKETLLASDADYRIIISPNPIIGPDRILKGDNQANINGFWYEGQAFLDWLTENKLTNVILMNGDRHWQYHSIDKRHGRNVPEFSCGPTHDDHVQPVPPPYDGVDRPYSASRGGFLTVTYKPDRTLTCQFHSQAGEPLYQHTFRP